jgi:hypothetical protein
MIHDFARRQVKEGVDARAKPEHDDELMGR